MNVQMLQIYAMKIDTLVPGILRGVLLEARDASGGGPVSRDERRIEGLCKVEALPDMGGPVAFSVTVADLQELTLVQAIHYLEARVIAKVSHLPVNLLCRFIGRKRECDVRRMQARAVKFGLLRYNRHGKLREV